MRPAFSKDASGNLVRNYYCIECFAGPFNRADIDNHIFMELGYGRQSEYFCRKCCLKKLPRMMLQAVTKRYLAKEEYIVSGKALHDLENNIPSPSFEEIPYEIPETKNIPIEPAVTPQHGVDIFEEEEEPGHKEISLRDMTAYDIVSLVESKINQHIGFSLKSKRSILKSAKRILEEKGLKVLC
jgi:hypothetical protein